jgi:hypothetical protein
MKIIKILPPLVLIFTCFCFAECKKQIHTPNADNPYGLPNATQTGAGVFACRINGLNFVAPNSIGHQGGGVGNDSIEVMGSGPYNHFFANIFLGVIDSNVTEKTVYSLSDTAQSYCVFITDSTCQTIVSISKFNPHFGSLTFSKIDKNKRILSGTFNFKIPVPHCDTLNATDGRFDIRY